jgi:hypothetical protein
LNGRLQSILVALSVCLIGVPALSRFQTAAVASPAEVTVRTPSEEGPQPFAVKTLPAAEPTVAAVARNASPKRNEAVLMNVAEVDAAGVSPNVLALALRAVSCAVSSGDIRMPRTLTVIDYSLPSVDERLWVFEVATGRLLFKELVAHGRNTGENMATEFSDRLNSRQSSIGLFVTDDTYVGSNGYSLRLNGLEPGYNAHARERAIVMHGAPYVNTDLVKSQGRIGRSWGCPALREAVARDVIDTIRGGGVIFSYYPDEEWLDESKFLNCGESTGSSVAG